MFWRFRLHERVHLFITNTDYKRQLLVQRYGIDPDRVFCIEEQTDTQFFRPGPPTPGRTRPLIGSGGLEQRDYATLAEATRDLDVDVRISAVSPNAGSTADFPAVWPANMTARHHDWKELRQLYRDSDVVVISLKSHSYQAGMTTLFEALACKRPVVMTGTPGIVERFAAEGLITSVPPSSPAAMREAIASLLTDGPRAKRQAERGFAAVQSMHSIERYVTDLVHQIGALAPPPAVGPSSSAVMSR